MPDDLKKLLKNPYPFYWKLGRRNVSLGLIALFLTNAFETMIPWLVGMGLDQITKNTEYDSVFTTIGWLLLVTIFMSIARFSWRMFWGNFHHSVAHDLRKRVFNHMMDLGPSFFQKSRIGELMSLITNDVNSFRMAIGPGCLILFDGLSLVILILPFMFYISWQSTLICLALMPLVPFIVHALLEKLHKAYHARQDSFAAMSGVAQEIVTGIRVIKSFAQERFQTRYFQRFSKDFQDSCDRLAKTDAFFAPALEIPMALGCVIWLLMGGKQVIEGTLTLGAFFAFFQYVQRMVWPMEAIGFGIGHIQEGRASFNRIKDLLETETDIPDEGTVELSAFESLEVKNLTFTYPGQKSAALKNISFKISAKETMAIIGPTGSGKSTLLSLISRQYPAPQNTIFINGVAIEKIKISSLRKMMAVVPQEAFLFSKTITENLELPGWSADAFTATDALRVVELEQEVLSWPNGLSSMIGERGVNLSGGQRQRLTLARALLRPAFLLLLDDCMSAVDTETEERLQNAMTGRIREHKALIFVTHRLSSALRADRFLILKDGTIETAENSQFFKQLEKTQRKEVTA